MSIDAFSRVSAIGRRGFLQGTAAAGATLLLPGRLRAQTPQSGGRFRMGMSEANSTDALTPGNVVGSMTHLINNSIRNCLIELSPSGELVPELAESWETEDAKTWSFKIRSGVEFHNGKTLTPEDVVYSLNLHRGEETASAGKSVMAAATEVRADGDRVTIVLDQANVDFPSFLTDDNFVIVMDGASAEELAGGGVGTGGYVVDRFNPGVDFIGKRHANYWKEGRAHFDEIELIGIPDANARMNALMGGQVDAINKPEDKTLALLGSASGVKIQSIPSMKHLIFAMRADTPPFDNPDVRLALKHAIDREAILSTVLRGNGSLGNDQPIGPSNQFFDASIPQRSYDPEKAKYHLEKAGLSNLEVELSAAENAWAGAVDAATLYAEHAKAAGINIKVVREPADGYWSNVWMKKPWFASWAAGRVSENLMMTLTYSAGAKWNETYWDNARFNELLVASRAETDAAKRAEMMSEMQLIIRDDGGSVIPAFANWNLALSDKVGHGEIAGQWDNDARRCTERWWFA
ncbi:MAG: ABC transporter substrate-binding protein [Roseovarius sp.]